MLDTLGGPSLDVYQFMDVNGTLRSATVINEVNFLQIEGNAFDFCIQLLDADLHESITPVLVAGNWIAPQYNITATTYDKCIQYASVMGWGNDGHISPYINTSLRDTTVQLDWFNNYTNIWESNFTYAGETLTAYEINRPHAFVQTHSTGSKFYHNVRGGDSGSPVFVPVGTDGWAIRGINEASPSPAALNAFIRIVDAKHGISTGYTVTVAADPTI